MAYRFDGVDDNVEFAIAPFTGYLFGACTFAVLLKRNSLGTTDLLTYFSSSGGSDRSLLRLTGTNVINFARSGTAANTTLINDTSKWYLLVVTTAAGTATPRFHIHDGSAWVHENGGATTGDISAGATVGTDRLFVSQPFSSVAAGVDLVCCGVKKASSTDLQVETLSRTAFSAWVAFGFDWLVGFDSSLVSGGVLQDQASPGTGDEIARTGTTAVADPPGWSFALAVAPVADFTGTPLTGSWPLNVAFTDASTNTPTSWAWTFGDGGTSSSQNPTHVYAAAGTYTVTLQATNAGGSNTKTRTGYITVANPSGSFTKVKWGSGLVVTDEGSGVIKVDGPTGSGLPADLVVAAGTRLLTNKLLAADTQPAFRMMGDGKLEWGAGGTGALDTNLYRSAANTLKTDGNLVAAGAVQANGVLATLGAVGPGYGLLLVSDTNLYRFAATVLKTDGHFVAGANLIAQQTLAAQVWLGDKGPAAQAGIAFGAASDVSLYRPAANVLRTDGRFEVGNLAVPITAAAVGGAQANKFPVYNQATGALVGYVPIYAT